MGELEEKKNISNKIVWLKYTHRFVISDSFKTNYLVLYILLIICIPWTCIMVMKVPNGWRRLMVPDSDNCLSEISWIITYDKHGFKDLRRIYSHPCFNVIIDLDVFNFFEMTFQHILKLSLIFRWVWDLTLPVAISQSHLADIYLWALSHGIRLNTRMCWKEYEAVQHHDFLKNVGEILERLALS